MQSDHEDGQLFCTVVTERQIRTAAQNADFEAQCVYVWIEQQVAAKRQLAT